mmetsp:Transcript_23409/g.25984  ORF Transcript_23409/g.25984 Transcript_23409/m.25984 type:complete len:156 (+) Transcript_23409:59-526(+)|eukprot:CAMPEP_0168529468 /NCGR_PEP_ID=MMETSP0405-20121227/13934_1 /TAXON_ID=498012 /ORGANISM="Trichosphaerium sp, Strain Am-I-7 wt" /LENGTH=155 /DNA_ID=CAMNT_0008553213 /DNA_START=34 /DNA_END=501 /DNA_ORIENTATION=+
MKSDTVPNTTLPTPISTADFQNSTTTINAARQKPDAVRNREESFTHRHTFSIQPEPTIDKMHVFKLAVEENGWDWACQRYEKWSYDRKREYNIRAAKFRERMRTIYAYADSMYKQNMALRRQNTLLRQRNATFTRYMRNRMVERKDKEKGVVGKN